MFFRAQMLKSGARHAAPLLVLFAVAMLVTPAWSQAFSGSTGFDTPSASEQVPVQAQPQATPPATVPPVFDSVPQVQGQGLVPPQVPQMHTQPQPATPGIPAPPAFDPRLIQQQHAQPTTPATPAVPAVPGQPMTATPPAAAELPPDPCAAYLSSYEYYAICQDRIQRLERMKEAQEKRAAARDEARQRLEEQRREAEEQRNQQQPRQRRMIRPGQVEPPPPAPRPVQIVEPDSTK